MRCRLFMTGAALLGLAFAADTANAGSGYVPAPQAIAAPQVASKVTPVAQAPSPQVYAAPQCDAGPVVYETCDTGCGGGLGLGHKLGGCLSGVKGKLCGLGSGLKCKAGELGHGLKSGFGKLGGCFQKKAVCAPACAAPVVYAAPAPSPQWASEQAPVVAAPQYAAPQHPAGQH